jgi:hypothetical protein
VNKAKYITGEYATEFYIDIDKLGIKEENVKDWYIKWHQLYVQDNDGVWTEHGLDFELIEDLDTKEPSRLLVVDENWEDSEWAGRTTDGYPKNY